MPVSAIAAQMGMHEVDWTKRANRSHGELLIDTLTELLNKPVDEKTSMNQQLINVSNINQLKEAM